MGSNTGCEIHSPYMTPPSVVWHPITPTNTETLKAARVMTLAPTHPDQRPGQEPDVGSHWVYNLLSRTLNTRHLTDGRDVLTFPENYPRGGFVMNFLGQMAGGWEPPGWKGVLRRIFLLGTPPLGCTPHGGGGYSVHISPHFSTNFSILVFSCIFPCNFPIFVQI